MLSIAKNRWFIFSREDAAVHYEHSQKVTGVEHFKAVGMIHTVTLVALYLGKTFTFLFTYVHG